MRTWCKAHPEISFTIAPVASLWPVVAESVVRLPFGYFLDYFLWLAAVPAKVRELQRTRHFDLAVHASLGCYWLPSPVAELGIPSVWGSVGGATRVAPGLLPVVGLRGTIERVLERIVVAVGAAWPATRRTMRRSTVVLLDNETTRAALPADIAERALVFHRALLSDVQPCADRPRGHDILFPSTLNGRKGALLALEAMRDVPAPYRLVFANEGPDEERLRRSAHELGLEDRVLFVGRIPRDEYFALAKASAMAVFAGVNEDGGCALCEAMMLGVPVVVLAHSGPKEIVDNWSLDQRRVVSVAPAGGVQATVQALADGVNEMIARSPTRADAYLDRDGAIDKLKRVYRQALTTVTAPAVGTAPTVAPAWSQQHNRVLTRS